MKSKDIQEALRAVPFVPFKVKTPDGLTLNIKNRDFVMFTPDYRTMHVYDVFENKNYKQYMLDVMLIPSIEFDERAYETAEV